MKEGTDHFTEMATTAFPWINFDPHLPGPPKVASILTHCFKEKGVSYSVQVKMPVSSRGYVPRLKFLPLPFAAKRYWLPNLYRNPTLFD